MREAVIVSTARTPIGKAYRGAFNDTQAQELIGHAVRHAADRAGVGIQREDSEAAGTVRRGTVAVLVAVGHVQVFAGGVHGGAGGIGGGTVR